MLFVGKDVEGERMEIMELKGMCLGFTQVMENLERIFQPWKITSSETQGQTVGTRESVMWHEEK